jgi:hypothetical protein
MCQAAPPKPPASPQSNAAILAATGQVPIRLTNKATLKQQTSPAPKSDPLAVPGIPGVTDTATIPANAAEMFYNVPQPTPRAFPGFQYLPTVLPADAPAPTGPADMKGYKQWNGKVQGIPLFRGAVANDTQLDPLVLDQRKGLPSAIGFSQLRRDLTFPTGR